MEEEYDSEDDDEEEDVPAPIANQSQNINNPQQIVV